LPPCSVTASSSAPSSSSLGCLRGVASGVNVRLGHDGSFNGVGLVVERMTTKP
jgi:hypothetical protein